jgi:zinc protease
MGYSMGMIFTQIWLAITVSVLVFTGGVLANPKPTVHTFDNGLTLVQLHDPHASIASAYVFVRTGSLFEQRWMGAGLSHYLEHLLASGTTKKRTEAEYQAIINELGGASNAYTTYDHTAYYIKSASSNLPKALDVLYEWMFQANWTPQEYEREKGVIIKEMERAKSNVARQVYQKTQSLFYKDSPYRYPVIGYQDVFLNTTSADLMSYYKSTYVPENMVVVVGGDLSGLPIYEQVKKGFGAQPKMAAPLRPYDAQPGQLSSSTTVVVMEALQTNRIVMRFPTVSFFDQEVYPLDLLAYILGNGEQSMLYQEFVVERQLATQIQVKSITPMYTSGYFEIVIESNQNPESIVQQVQDTLTELSWKNLKAAQISKAIAQKKAEYRLSKTSLYRSLEDIGQAMMMGQNPLFFEFYSHQFEAVNSDRISDVSSRFLTPDRRQTYLFQANAPSPRPLDTAPVSSVQIESLPNGVTLIKAPHSNPDIVKITLHLAGGIEHDTVEKNGLGTLSAQLIGKKIKGMTRQKFQNEFEKRGAIIQAAISNQSLMATLTVQKKDVSYLAPLFVKSVSRFDATIDMFDEVKSQQLDAIRKKNEDWFSDAMDHVKSAVVTSNSAFSWPLSGTLDSVNTISLEDVMAYVQRRYIASPLTIVVQSVDPKTVWNTIKNGVDISTPQQRQEPVWPVFNPAAVHDLSIDSSVGVVMRIDPISIEQLTPRQYAKLQLVDAVVSGISYPSGLLHQRLRQNQLVYVVHTVHIKWGGQHMLFTYALTDPKNVGNAAKIIDESFAEIKTNISNKQIRLAKNQVMFNVQSNRENLHRKTQDLIVNSQLFGTVLTAQDIENELISIDAAALKTFAATALAPPHVVLFNQR